MTPAGRLRPVLMIVHSYYDEDPRVRREAEALVGSGRRVTVIGLRREGDDPEATVEGVRVVRLDVQRHQGAGLGVYLREYTSFGLRASLRALRLHRQDPAALVQVHSLPDFLAFAALPLRLAGIPLLLDLHEAMPELFRSRFPRAASPWVQRALRLQERASIALSTMTLSVNAARHERLLGMGIQPRKLAVVENCPSLARFDPGAHPRRPFAEDGVVRLVYAGALTPIYELDVVIRGLARVARTRPDLRLVLDVYGRGDAAEALEALVHGEGLSGTVRFHGRIPIDAVPGVLARADVGLAPTRLDPFTELCLSTKVYEYAAMEKPVVASRLPLAERTFGDGALALYDAGDPSSFARALERVIDDTAFRGAAVAAATEVVLRSGWEVESVGYVGLVNRLATDRPRWRAASAQPTPSSR